MTTYKFDSKIKLLSKFEADKTQIKNEPMLFNCDLSFAYENGGQITRNFIDQLPYDWQCKDVVIDTRCHMLMPGWYPAIPGYHHDDVPRAIDIPAGQHFGTAGQPVLDASTIYTSLKLEQYDSVNVSLIIIPNWLPLDRQKRIIEKHIELYK